MHFCVPLQQISIPQSSTATSCPPREVTVSTMNSAPYCFASCEASTRGCKTPVDVSACTKASILTFFLDFKAASMASGATILPQSAVTGMTSAPHLAALSTILSPKTPLTPMTTVSPGSRKLQKLASMPAEPVPEIGKVSRFCVRKR